MAKKAETTKKPEVAEKAPAKVEKKTTAVSTMTAAELAAKAAAVHQADQVSRSQDGATFSYISLAKDKTKALDEDEKELYIPGLAMKDFFVQSIKKILGKKLTVVPLMFITVYGEYDGPGGKAKFCGLWHKDDAMKFPADPTSSFNRLMPNRHELRPQKFVFVYVPEHEDLVLPVISFKVTGNKIAKAWIKDLEGRRLTSCQAQYVISAEKQKNDKGDTWLDVGFEFDGEVYSLGGKDGFVAHEEYAEKVLMLAEDLNKAYNMGLLIARRSTESAMRHAGSSAAEDDFDDDDDDEAPAF